MLISELDPSAVKLTTGVALCDLTKEKVLLDSPVKETIDPSTFI